MRARTRLIQKMLSYVGEKLLILLTYAAFYDISVMTIVIRSTQHIPTGIRTCHPKFGWEWGRNAFIKCALLCGWTLTLSEELPGAFELISISLYIFQMFRYARLEWPVAWLNNKKNEFYWTWTSALLFISPSICYRRRKNLSRSNEWVWRNSTLCEQWQVQGE